MDNSSCSPILIAGLGNPGQAYRHNRHNVGFMVVDRLAYRLGCVFSRLESKALLSKADYKGKRILIAKPRTYMNLSGLAVSALLRYYRVPLENFLVVYDDIDLPLGTLRLRPEGGSGGQKGVASIIEQLGTEEFPRLRVGIDPPPGSMQASDYVLQDFSSSEADNINPVLDRAVDAILVFIVKGLESAMNKFNPVLIE